MPARPEIPLIYDNITLVSWGEKVDITTRYLVRQGQKYGLMESDNEFCISTGGWIKNQETGKSDFGDDGLIYDEIKPIGDEWFLMRQGTKYGLFNLILCCFIGDEVAYDEIRRVGKKQYLTRQDTVWRVLTLDNLTHPFSPPFDELRKVPDGTFWFRKGGQTGIYDPESGIDSDED